MARLHFLKHVDLDNCYWGVSTSLWFNGCPHHCKGCWNAETWEIDRSLEKPNEEIIKETLFALDEFGMKKDLSLLGGDPLAYYNLADTIEILKAIKEQRPQTRVLCWTGFSWQNICTKAMHLEALQYIDILIDGKYKKELHIEGHKYGSSNQKLVDVKESLKQNKKIVAPENYWEVK